MEEQELLQEVANKLNWSLEKLRDTIPVTKQILEIFESADLKWANVSSPETLISLRPIMHPKYADVFESADLWKSVCTDIKLEITFIFYWNEGFLCWER